jgi:hypothetical protein
MLFTHTTVKKIAALIDASQDEHSKQGSALTSGIHERSGTEATHSPGSHPSSFSSQATLLSPGFDAGHPSNSSHGQKHPLSLIIQAIPFIFFYPLKAALTCKSYNQLNGGWC